MVTETQLRQAQRTSQQAQVRSQNLSRTLKSPQLQRREVQTQEAPDTSKIDNELKSWEDRVAYYENQAKRIRETSQVFGDRELAQLNSIDENLGEARQAIQRLSRAKQRVVEGYTQESALDVANIQISGRSEKLAEKERIKQLKSNLVEAKAKSGEVLWYYDPKTKDYYDPESGKYIPVEGVRTPEKMSSGIKIPETLKRQNIEINKQVRQNEKDTRELNKLLEQNKPIPSGLKNRINYITVSDEKGSRRLTVEEYNKQAKKEDITQQTPKVVSFSGLDSSQLSGNTNLSSLNVSKVNETKVNIPITTGAVGSVGINLSSQGMESNVSTRNISLLTGMAVGVSNNVSETEQPSGFFSTISSWFTGGKKEGEKKANEIYSPALGGFVQAEPNSNQFLDVTAQVRPPTSEEAKAIQRASYSGSWEGIKETIGNVGGEVKQSVYNVFTPIVEKSIPLTQATQQVQDLGLNLLSAGYEEIRPSIRQVAQQDIFLFNKAKEKGREVSNTFNLFTDKTSRAVEGGVLGFVGETLLFGEEVKKEGQKVSGGFNLFVNKLSQKIPTPTKTYNAPPSSELLSYWVSGQPQPITNKERQAYSRALNWLGGQTSIITSDIIGVKESARKNIQQNYGASLLFSDLVSRKVPPITNYFSNIVGETTPSLVSPFYIVGEDISKKKTALDLGIQKTGQGLLDLTGVSDIQEIRRLNIEAKKKGQDYFEFITTRGTIEKVPTASTWFGASLNVAGVGAEYLSRESGLAEKRLEFRKNIERQQAQNRISDMASSFQVPRYEASEKEIEEEAKFIGEQTKQAIKFGAVDLPLIYATGKVYSGLPPLLQTSVDLGFTGYGGYKVVTGETPEEKIQGGLFLGLGALGLTGKAVRAYNKPIIKRVAVGRNTFIEAAYPYGDDLGNFVLYPKQQVRAITKEGQRTVVSKQGSNYFRRLFGKESKPIYEGIYYSDKAGYNKALKLLTKSGYSESQARNVLRYTAPQNINQFLEGGLKLEGSKAVGEFTTTTTKPVSIIDETFRIKTRGGATVQEVTPISRVGANKGNLGLFFEQGTNTNVRFNKNIFTGIDSGEYFIGAGVTKQGDLVKGLDVKGLPVEYKDLYSFSAKKDLFPYNEKITGSASRTVLFRREPIEEVKISNIIGGKRKSSKEYLESLYQTDFLKTAPQVAPPKITTPKLELPSPSSKPSGELFPLVSARTSSVYAGTGQYEQTFGGILPPSTQSGQEGFMSYSAININQPQVKVESTSILQPKQNEIIKSNLGIRSANILENLTRPEIKSEVKQNLESRQGLKVATALDTLLRQSQKTSLKQKSARESTRRPKTITKISPPIVPFSQPEKKSSKEKVKEIAEGLFSVFTRKGGEDIEIGEFTTKEEAGKALKTRLAKTLRASGFVVEKKTGRKVSLGELNLGLGFRKSKKDEFRIVEEKSLRLRKGGTGKEIQYFRNTKSKRGKSNPWLKF